MGSIIWFYLTQLYCIDVLLQHIGLQFLASDGQWSNGESSKSDNKSTWVQNQLFPNGLALFRYLVVRKNWEYANLKLLGVNALR